MKLKCINIKEFLLILMARVNMIGKNNIKIV